jgi:aspartate carbamoyltransferase catalytic subunit
MYKINKKTLMGLPEYATVMHPLPRAGEIDPEIDSDPRADYFEQANYGVPTRMSIILTLFGLDEVFKNADSLTH